MIDSIDLVGRPFLLSLAGLALLALVAAAFWRPGRMRRVLTVLAIVLVAGTASAGINGYFGYVRTIGQAFGGVTGNVVDASELDSRCHEVPSEGLLVEQAIPGERSGFDARAAWVWYPPAWCLHDDTAYPVIMLLHGTPGSTKDWVNAGLANRTADRFASHHGGRSPILVMPDTGGGSDTECVNSRRYGEIETYLTRDVPDWVDRTIGSRAAERPEGWAVAGLSMGGTCSLMLTLRHPDVFATFGDYSGELFGLGSEAETVRVLFDGDRDAYERHDPLRLMADGKDLSALGGWFQVGGADPTALRDTRTYAEAARRAGMEVCLVVVPGMGHSFVLWSRAFEDSLPWMAARTGLIAASEEQRAACES